MSELAVLGLEIDSRPAVQAATDLDRMTGAAERTERATDSIRSSIDGVVTALRANTAATSALTQAMQAQQSAASRASGAMAGVSAATDSATSNVIQFSRASTEARARMDGLATSTRSMGAAWKAFGDQGAEAYRRIEVERARAEANAAASARIGGMGSPVPAAGGSTRDGRLTAAGAQNLFYQGTDVAASLASGMSPFTIALQQGGQIAPTFMGPGGASIRGVMSQIGEGVTGLASKIGPFGFAMGGVAATVGLATAALISYRSRQAEAERQLDGIGRASGLTITQLNAVADANARAGRISIGSAREYAASFAGTGRIGGEIAGGLVTTVRDYAKTTGQDASEAAKELGAAFADPAKGADALNAKLGFLNDTVRENVRRLVEQGDRLGAQRALLSAYRDNVTSSVQATQGWTAITEALGNGWDRIGRNVSKAIFGGTLDQELAKAQERLSRAQVAAEGGFGLFSSKDIETAQKDVDRFKTLVDERDRKIEEAQRAQRSLEIGGIIRSLLPEQQELQRLQDQVERVRRAIAEPVKFGLDSRALSEAEGAFGRISRLAHMMRDDVEKFGSSATAALNRTADFNSQLVGATPYGRSAAEVEKQYQDALRAKGLDPSLSVASVNADYTQRLNDPNLDSREGQTLVAAREAALRNAAEREGLQRARDVELSTLQQTDALSLTQRGGAFARAPADIQRQIQEATQRFPTVDPAVLAGLLERESNFTWTGPTKELGPDGRPKTTAWGRGQITNDAAADIRNIPGMEGFDKYNVDTQVMGAAAYLSLRQKWVNGDQIKALDGYGTGPGYGLDVMRRAGTLGDVSSLGVARDMDAQDQAAKRAGETARQTAEYYGKNGLAMEASGRAAEQYQQMLARGVPASDALKQALLGYSTAAESAARRTNLIKFVSDDEFSREQLGRNATDAQAYAAARQRFGDTSSDEARTVIDRTRETTTLTETKGMIVDTATSFATALRRGTDASKAFSDALGNVADRMLGKVIDSAVSGLFGGAMNGGLASFAGFNPFGYADGGFTGYGSRYQPAGVVHRGEVVFSQTDVARFGGVGAVEAMRRGLPGYADGGAVGWRQAPMPAANGNGGSVNLQIVNNGTPQQVDNVREERDDRGNRTLIAQTSDMVAAAVSAPGPGRRAVQRATASPYVRR